MAYVSNFQASKSPCLKQKGGNHLRNDNRECLLTSTHMPAPTHKHIHIQKRKKNRTKTFGPFCVTDMYIPCL